MMVPLIQHSLSQEERRLGGNPRLDILSLVAMLVLVCLQAFVFALLV